MAYPGEQPGHVDICEPEVSKCVNAFAHRLQTRSWQVKVSNKTYWISHDFSHTVKITFARNTHDIEFLEFSFQTVQHLEEDYSMYGEVFMQSMCLTVSIFDPSDFRGAEMMLDCSSDDDNDNANEDDDNGHNDQNADDKDDSNDDSCDDNEHNTDDDDDSDDTNNHGEDNRDDNDNGTEEDDDDNDHNEQNVDDEDDEDDNNNHDKHHSDDYNPQCTKCQNQKDDDDSNGNNYNDNEHDFKHNQ